MKKIRYFIEFIFLYIFFSILKVLPMNFVSKLGGILFQLFGPYTKNHKVAVSNYKKIYCNLNKNEIKKRLSLAVNEISHYDEYKYVLVNDNIIKTVNNIIRIIEFEEILNQINENTIECFISISAVGSV